MSRRLLVALWLATLVPGAALAAGSQESRAERWSRLPDWSGFWVVEGPTGTLDGRQGAVNGAPYTPAWQRRYAQARSDASRLRDSYERFCYAAMPRMMASPQTLMFVVTPEETLVHGSRHDIRHIWTDGRAHPPADELWPLFWGESVGRWEGDTLRVETVSLKGGLWLDPGGATLSDQARVSERLRRVGRDRIRNDITIVDPLALSRPWRFTRTYRRSSATDLPEEDCNWTAGSGARAEKPR